MIILGMWMAVFASTNLILSKSFLEFYISWTSHIGCVLARKGLVLASFCLRTGKCIDHRGFETVQSPRVCLNIFIFGNPNESERDKIKIYYSNWIFGWSWPTRGLSRWKKAMDFRDEFWKRVWKIRCFRGVKILRN